MTRLTATGMTRDSQLRLLSRIELWIELLDRLYKPFIHIYTNNIMMMMNYDDDGVIENENENENVILDVNLGIIVSVDENLDVNVDVDENLHVSLTMIVFLSVSLPVCLGWI
jgi:hypothetical protein